MNQPLENRNFRIYADPLSKSGYMGIGKVTEVDGYNRSGQYAECRVHLLSGIRYSPNLIAWIDVDDGVGALQGVK
jgi:hypothetical protein